MADRNFLQGDAEVWRRTGQAVPAEHGAPTAAAASTEIGAEPEPERKSVSPVFEGLLTRWTLLSACVMVGAIAAFVLWVTA